MEVLKVNPFFVECGGSINLDKYLPKQTGNAGKVLHTDGGSLYWDWALDINSLTQKVTPISTDLVVIEDSEDSYNKKKVLISALGGGGGDSYWSRVTGTPNYIQPETLGDHIRTMQSGESYARIELTDDGLLRFGGGSSPVDVWLYRAGAGIIQNSGKFYVVNGVHMDDIYEYGSSGITVTTSSSSKGLYYAADYSSGATDRWIADKAYVDSVAGASGTFIGLTDTPGAWTGTAGHFVIVNSTPNALIFQDPSSYNLSNFNDDLTHTDTNAIHDNVSQEIQAVATKSSPVDADVVLIEDSAASWAKKSVTIANLLSGTTYTFSDGLTETAGDVDLGGSISASVALTVADSVTFRLEDADGGSAESYVEFGPTTAAEWSYFTVTMRGTTSQIQFHSENATGSAWTGIDIENGSIEITDTVSSKGMYYVADYSSGATARWIPDKAYVDSVSGTDSAAIHDDTADEINQITSKAVPITNDIVIIEDSAASWVKKKVALGDLPFSSVNSGSGITIDGSNNIDLGGTLDADAIVESQSSADVIRLEGDDQSNYSTRLSVGTEQFYVYSYATTGYVTTSGYSLIDMWRGTYVILTMSSNGTLVKTLNINASQMLITDTISTKGLEYAADYSTSWGDRSIPDKAYVDSVAGSSSTFIGLSDTPSAWTGAAGYLVMVNSTPNALVFQQPSSYTLSNFSNDLTDFSYINLTGTNFTAQEAGTNFIYHSDSDEHILIGIGAGDSLTTGALYNIAIGDYSLSDNTTGDNNVAIGSSALENDLGSNNIAIGITAGQGAAATTHLYNVFIGTYAGRYLYTGAEDNIIIGYYAGYGNISPTAVSHTNVLIGGAAGRDINGATGNVGIGYHALTDLIGGDDNIAIGKNSGDLITSGSTNLLIGRDTAGTLTTGTTNLIIGHYIDVDSSSATEVFRLGYDTTHLLEGSLSSGSQWWGSDYEFRLNNFMEFDEMTAPGNPAADKGRLYVADNGGTTTLYFKDSSGTVTNLLQSGSSHEIRADSGVSVTTSGTGVTFSSSFSDTNYAIHVRCFDGSGNNVDFTVTSKATSGFTITPATNCSADYICIADE